MPRANKYLEAQTIKCARKPQTYWVVKHCWKLQFTQFCAINGSAPKSCPGENMALLQDFLGHPV